MRFRDDSIFPAPGRLSPGKAQLTARVEDGPGAVLAGFGTALCARDAVGASRLLSRDACFVTPDSTVIHGRSAVSSFLRQLVGMATEMTIDQRSMLTAGEVALASERWSLRSGGAAGTMLRTTRAKIVLAQIEGAWRIAVVDPWRAP